MHCSCSALKVTDRNSLATRRASVWAFLCCLPFVTRYLSVKAERKNCSELAYNKSCNISRSSKLYTFCRAGQPSKAGLIKDRPDMFNVSCLVAKGRACSVLDIEAGLRLSLGVSYLRLHRANSKRPPSSIINHNGGRDQL